MKNFIQFVFKFLETLANVNLSPVMTARCLYVFFSTLYNANSFYIGNETMVKTTDFPIHNIRIKKTVNDFFDYVILEFTINHINTTLLSNSLNPFNFVTWFELDSLKYTKFKLSRSVIINSMLDKINEYLLSRDNDGWKSANTQKILPNGNYKIQTESLQNDIPENGWCPLNVNGTNQTPLHPSIELVRPVINNNYYTEFSELYNNISQEQKNKEYEEVYTKSLNLTDEEKMIAEFWSGGPNTIKPPGFWNLFLYTYHLNLNSSYTTMVKNFFLLNAGLFQIGLCVWYAKYQIFQKRPIQYIRNMDEQSFSDFYFNDITSSKLWLPYQERNFVTPPFPDFISGHSTFSAIGSEILNKLLGENLLNLNLKIPGNQLKIICPLFTNKYDSIVSLSCINIYPKTSNIIENIYPTKMVNLRFNSWNDMSIQAGISRIYGGIHIHSSNYPGIIVGKKVATDILDTFN